MRTAVPEKIDSTDKLKDEGTEIVFAPAPTVVFALVCETGFLPSIYTLRVSGVVHHSHQIYVKSSRYQWES